MPRYERNQEFRDVTLDGTTLRMVIGKRGGFFRRRLKEKTENKTFDSSLDARLAFARLTRELREDGFVCIESGRRRSGSDAVAAATRAKFESALERDIPDPLRATDAHEALAGLYELRQALVNAATGTFFPDLPNLLDDLDPEPHIERWEQAVVRRFGGPLSLIELHNRHRLEEMFDGGQPPESLDDVTDFEAARALNGLYQLGETVARSHSGDFFPDAPHLTRDLEPEPLLAAWREKLVAHHGDVGHMFFAEIAADHGVIIPDVDLRTGRRRQTFRPPKIPLSGRGFDRSGDGDLTLVALEEQLLENREDRDAYAVYADRLQELGNPFGELIAISLADEDGGGRRREQFLQTHGAEVLGSLAEIPQEGIELTWRHGFVAGARFADRDNDELGTGLESLLECPAGALLTELTLGMMGDYELDYHDCVETLIDTGPHKALRSLFLGDFEYPDEMEMSWAIVGDVSELWKACPDLRELTLQGADIELGDIDAPHLRRLSLRTGGLPLAAVESIAAAEWPRLVELELWFGDEAYGAEVGIEDIAPLLAGERMPALRTLRLMNAELSDDIARSLSSAKILPQLKVVDLSMGTLSAVGARAIADEMTSFEHLERLELGDNYLGAAARELFEQRSFVIIGTQKDEDEDDGEVYRYVTVGE